MPKNRKRNNRVKKVFLPLFALVCFTVVIAAMLWGNNIALFHTRGLIAHEQRSLMLLIVGILLVVAVPAVFLLYFVAWKYRETNKKAKYQPDARHGKFLVMNIWLVPTIFMVILALIMWPATHRLAPQKSIAADAKPLTIQVVSMRWKWLFIYPEQHIATVNFVQIPVDTPVRFELTADEAPMSSFWIPNLGGQLYSMTGMINPLNLMADTVGDYNGSSAEINGAGFAGMKFTARVSPQSAFDFWAQTVKQGSTGVLDADEYSKLLKPSENNPASSYSSVDKDLYDTVLMKYMPPYGGGMRHGERHE